VTAPAKQPGVAAERLAVLREDLQFAGAAEDGPTRDGVLFDPVRQRYFRLDATTAALLSLWPHCETRDQLADASRERFGILAGTAQIDGLSTFLTVNELVVPQDESDWRRLVVQERRSQKGWLSWLVHHYLFIQIPLIDPKRLLVSLAPLAAPLYTRIAAAIFGAFGICGLYLVSRQWDQFLGTFPHLFSMQGAILYAFAIVLVKTVHELAHAITAHRFGCRVPSMGICFMVMMPMLYSDVTDAWRLRSRRQKLAIDAAGLIAETGLASAATFLWAFLPDGPERSIAFAVATTSWVLSLGLNLNPFMRFDGYYLLTDATGIDNLQPRSFAIGRWRLRELLFDLAEPPPERLGVRTRRLMALYAYAVWLYRLVVFTGIAVLVYSMSFKLLGLVLFGIEIIFFIALPIVREIGAWTRMRRSIAATRRTCITATLLLAAIVAALIPWSTRIVIPAVVEDAHIQRVFPKRAAQVLEVRAVIGAQVKAGDVIIRLELPELEHDIRRSKLASRAVQLRLDRRSADATDRAETIVLEDNLASLKSRIAGLETERDELTIRAEKAGRVAEIDRQIEQGRWMQRSDPVAVIVGGREPVVRGYLGELDIGRLATQPPGSELNARFIPEDPLKPSLQVLIETIAPVGSDDMEIQELSSHYGGGVAARTQQRPGKGRVQVGLQGQFLVTGRIVGAEADHLLRIMRGTLHATGRAESLAERAWRQVLKVLIRESGL
jgi:putative peptide zinc metalloprotease protein